MSVSRSEMYQFVEARETMSERRSRCKRLRLWILSSILAVLVAWLVYQELCQPAELPDLRSVVRVRSDFGSGSGVIVGPRRILTAAHVVVNNAYLAVDIYDGEASRTVFATVHAIDMTQDLALLVVDDVLEHAAVIGVDDARAMPIGAPLVAVGATTGHTPAHATRGYLSARGVRYPAIQNCWQASTAIFFGNSGGGIFGASGRLIGITVAMDAPNVTFFIPAGALAAFLEDHP